MIEKAGYVFNLIPLENDSFLVQLFPMFKGVVWVKTKVFVELTMSPKCKT